MPNPAPIIAQPNGANQDALTWETTNKWGILPIDTESKKGKLLFPRIDVEKELSALEECTK